MEQLSNGDFKLSRKQQRITELAEILPAGQLIDAAFSVNELADEFKQEGDNPETHKEERLKHYAEAEKRRGLARSIAGFVPEIPDEVVNTAAGNLVLESEIAERESSPMFIADDELDNFTRP